MSNHDCEYPNYETIGISSWFCSIIDGVISQDFCQQHCRHFPNLICKPKNNSDLQALGQQIINEMKVKDNAQSAEDVIDCVISMSRSISQMFNRKNGSGLVRMPKERYEMAMDNTQAKSYTFETDFALFMNALGPSDGVYTHRMTATPNKHYHLHGDGKDLGKFEITNLEHTVDMEDIRNNKTEITLEELAKKNIDNIVESTGIPRPILLGHFTKDQAECDHEWMKFECHNVYGILKVFCPKCDFVCHHDYLIGECDICGTHSEDLFKGKHVEQNCIYPVQRTSEKEVIVLKSTLKVETYEETKTAAERFAKFWGKKEKKQ